MNKLFYFHTHKTYDHFLGYDFNHKTNKRYTTKYKMNIHFLFFDFSFLFDNDKIYRFLHRIEYKPI